VDREHPIETKREMSILAKRLLEPSSILQISDLFRQTKATQLKARVLANRRISNRKSWRSESGEPVRGNRLNTVRLNCVFGLETE